MQTPCGRGGEGRGEEDPGWKAREARERRQLTEVPFSRLLCLLVVALGEGRFRSRCGRASGLIAVV